MQGYDPRGLAEYYRMFRREFRRACELYGLAGKIGRAADDPELFITTWDETTKGDDWQVETRWDRRWRTAWCGDRLGRLAVAPGIDWVDYQSRHDVMNFWPFDPIAGHGIALGDGARKNPTVVTVSFRDLWKTGHLGRRRWRFFRAHFQFLHANERLGAAYDYYLICCGPLDLMTRATAPEVAIAAIGTHRSGVEPATQG